MMKHSAILFCATLFLSSHAYAWTYEAGFECGTVGAQIEMSTGCGIKNKILSEGSSEVAIDDISLKVAITKGTEDSNEFGGKILFGDGAITSLGGGKLVEGDEVWYRIYYFFPNGFDFSATGSGLKIARLHVIDGGGSHEGYMSIHIQGNLSIGSGIDRDGFKANNGGNDKFGTTVQNGKWMALEHYVKLSPTPGVGIARVWQDGNLIFEDKQTKTMRTSASRADEIFIFTYWNGGAPKDQYAFIDEIIVTTDIPGNKDSEGNNYIGTGDVTILAAPKPPTITN